MLKQNEIIKDIAASKIQAAFRALKERLKFKKFKKMKEVLKTTKKTRQNKQELLKINFDLLYAKKDKRGFLKFCKNVNYVSLVYFY